MPGCSSDQALTQRQSLLVGLAGLVEPADLDLDVTQVVVDHGQVAAMETVVGPADDRLEDVNGFLVRLRASAGAPDSALSQARAKLARISLSSSPDGGAIWFFIMAAQLRAKRRPSGRRAQTAGRARSSRESGPP